MDELFIYSASPDTANGKGSIMADSTSTINRYQMYNIYLLC